MGQTPKKPLHDTWLPEGRMECTGTKGVAFVLASRGPDVMVPRTLYTGAKSKLLDCHK